MIYTFKNMNGEEYFFHGENLKIYETIDSVQKVEKIRPIDDFRNDFFSYLTIIMCNDCNLACSYCYEGQGNFKHSGRHVILKQAYKAIDVLLESVDKHHYQYMGITFFGGEPLLRFDDIKDIVSYCDEHKNRNTVIHYCIVTNGTLLTEEKREFFKKHNFHITLSIDGDKETHDKERKFKNGKGSYDIIAENVRNYLPNFKLKARITVNNSNHDIFNSVKKFVC